MGDHEAVLSFWLGELDADGMARKETSARWWKKDPAFDQEIRERFMATYDAIVAGGHRDWLATPRGRVAYVIVLDQFSRNMFRGTAKMFAADPLALAAAIEGLDAGVDAELAPAECTMLYMPLMHSEAMAMQERCIERFGSLRDRSAGVVSERAADNLKFAIAHRDIIAKWKRFPHRNETLGRPSTPEELEFLKQPGSGF